MLGTAGFANYLHYIIMQVICKRGDCDGTAGKDQRKADRID